MRFLQIEWHNHERARNSWDIERAEMKAKIAKQEGECRHARKLNEQLERQVKMLENVVRNLRKDKGMPAEPKTTEAEFKSKKDRLKGSEEGNDAHTKRAHTFTPSLWEEDVLTNVIARNIPHNSFLDVDPSQDTAERDREQQIDKTTKYLRNCMKEIQYLLTTPQHPPPQVLPNGNTTGLPDAPGPLEDVHFRRQAERRSMQMQSMQQAAGMPDYQQPQQIPSSLPPGTHEGMAGPRGVRYNEYAEVPQAPTETLPQQPMQNAQMSFDEPVESVTHTFDSRGRPMTDEDQSNRLTRQPKQQQDPDGWTFDDEPPQPDQAPDAPRRPDTDAFPSAANTHLTAKSPPRTGSQSHRRKSSGSQAMARRRSSQGKTEGHAGTELNQNDPSQFKVKFALRGHLDVVRSVIFSGGGSPSEPEVCTAGDDGTIKRWFIPASYQNYNAPSINQDLDIAPYFSHRGHDGVVTSLAACPASTGFSTGGRANGDGWIFSGGQDATVRVWERGRIDPKATLEGHTDAVWCVCVLPAATGAVFGTECNNIGGPDRLLLVSGSADGTVKVWAVSAPPQNSSPSTGSRRGVGGSRRHSVTSGSNFPSSPQPSVASTTAFHHTLVHSIERPGAIDRPPRPTSICPLSPTGETFVVSYSDSSVLIFDTRTGEEVIGMASNETYDGTINTSINTVVATSTGLEGAGSGSQDTSARGMEQEEVGAGATGSRDGVEGVVITGHEDRYVRFFDANSGQCTYTMLAHPAALSSLCLSRDAREAVSAGHDASIRFWSLEKRICTQDIVAHRPMRGEGVCCVTWSQDGKLVVSAGGDGVVKVFARA
ncbi:WD40 repeat-like protein [Polychaeton citri CBS 116435]|uniref:WD40 repeat-like protein n=1 Tax=Polychaeton citri CBS 116435 TaxID=1314669 RepID=A0A9P4Q5A6_9PEZI|nr:WD40 repeat-like protein [Polychaeton citri CBS 116435]